MARPYFAAANPSEVTNTSNATWLDLVTLTFASVAGKTYAVLWSGEFANQSSTSSDYRLRTTVDGVQVDYSNNEPRATTEYPSHGGLLAVAGDGSSHTVALQIQAETDGNTIVARNGRLIALELGANDVVAEALTNQVTTSTTMTAAVSAVVPASGDYLLLGAGFTRSFANSVPVYIDLYDGSAGTVQNGSSSAEISVDPSFVPSQQIWKATMTAGGTASFRFRAHTNGSASDITNARILCLYLPDFDAALYAETTADNTSANGTTETTALTLSDTVTSNPHLILGQWHTSGTTNSINITSRLRDDGVEASKSIRRVYNAAVVRPSGSMSVSVRTDYPGGARDWILTREGAAAGNSTTMRQNSAIAVLDLGTAGTVVTGTATMSGSGGAAAVGRAVKPCTVALTGAGSLAATGRAVARATASLTGAGAISGVGRAVKPGAASLSGSGTLAGAGRAIVSGNMVLTGSGDLSAAGRAVKAAVAALVGSGSLDAEGGATAVGVVAWTGSGTFDAQSGGGTVIVSGTATMTGGGSLNATGGAIRAGTAALTGTSALTATGRAVVPALAALTGSGSLDVDGGAIAAGQASMSGAGGLTVVGGGIAAGVASWTGSGAFNASSVPPLPPTPAAPGRTRKAPRDSRFALAQGGGRVRRALRRS